MSLANLSTVYYRMRSALLDVAYVRGTHKGFTHIYYCRWCHYSRGYIDKAGHQGDCPLRCVLPENGES